MLAPKPFEKVTAGNKTEIIKEDFISGIINNGRRIHKSGGAVGGTTVIYTVPQGYTFFLVSSQLQHFYIDANTSGRLELSDGLPLLLSYFVANGSSNQTASYTIPLKFNSGEIFQVRHSGGSGSCSATLQGYEVPTGLIPKFV